MPCGSLKVLNEEHSMTVIHAIPSQSLAWLSHWRYLIPGLYDHHSCCNKSELWMTITIVLSHSSAWLSHMLYLLTALYDCQTCYNYSKLCITATLAVPTHSSVRLSNLLYLPTALYDECHTCCTYSQLCMTVKFAVSTHSSALPSKLLYLLAALYDCHLLCLLIALHYCQTCCTYSQLCMTATCCAYSQVCMTVKLAVPAQSSTWLSHLLYLLNAPHNHHTCCIYSAAQLVEAPLHITHYTLMHMPLIEKLSSLYNKIHHTYYTYSELCLTFWELLLDTCSSSGWSSSSQYSLHSDACACYRKNQNHFMVRMETNPSSPLLDHDANITGACVMF